MALGVPLPSTSERFERLEETFQVILQMWSDDNGPYERRNYELAETICSPSPLARPHPPIMIGGSGEQKTLLLVAKYADACNLFAGLETGPKAVRAKLDVLVRHCARAGTDVNRIRKTILWTAPLDPTSTVGAAEFIEQMKGFADVGILEVRVMPFQDPVGFIQGLGRSVVPAVSVL